VFVYEGEWKDGKRNGYGTQYRKGLIVYDGNWQGGKRKG
jgi:hypothetical protein